MANMMQESWNIGLALWSLQDLLLRQRAIKTIKPSEMLSKVGWKKIDTDRWTFGPLSDPNDLT